MTPRVTVLLAAGLVVAVGATSRASAQPTPSTAATPSAETIQQARQHFERGAAAYRTGQLKQAIDHFKRAHQLTPSPELEFDLAHVYERIGEAGEAIAYYRSYAKHGQVSDVERQDIERRIQGLVALQTRRRASLIERPPAREALAAEAQAFLQRGTKLFRQGNYEAALIAFTEAQRFAKMPELNYNMAVICERLNRLSEAVEYYRAYLRDTERPNDAEQVEARLRVLQPN